MAAPKKSVAKEAEQDRGGAPPEFTDIAKNDLAPGEQQRIETALAALKAVIGGDDRNAIHQRTHELNDVTKHLAEVAMNRSVHAALSGRSVNDM